MLDLPVLLRPTIFSCILNLNIQRAQLFTSAPEQDGSEGAGERADEKRVAHSCGILRRAESVVEQANERSADGVGCDADGERVDAACNQHLCDTMRAEVAS